MTGQVALERSLTLLQHLLNDLVGLQGCLTEGSVDIVSHESTTHRVA